MDFTNTILQGDCLSVLKTLPDKSIDCCVTSPPYWGLRDYGVEGQLGMETTPEEFVQSLVLIFTEVKRVLKDGGTVFLNLGDSYAGSGGAHKEHHANPGISNSAIRSGVQRVKTYDISDKEPEDYQGHGYLSESLCGVCQQACRHTSHIDGLLSPMLIASLFSPNHERMGFLNDHFPTLDFEAQVARILNASSYFLRMQDLSHERLTAFRQSMPSEFYQQLLDLCLLRGNFSFCPLCGRSSTVCGRQTENKLGDSIKQYLHNQNIELPFSQHLHHNLCTDMVSLYYNEILSYFTHIKPLSTFNNRANLKPKDLVGIPWMTAFALRASGWWLRQDIIWHKPNPMPESVTDRCTKSHEYIFLMSKSQKYYFDYEAIQEEANYDGRKDTLMKGSEKYADGNHLQSGCANSLSSKGRERWKFKNLQDKGQNTHSFHESRADGIPDEQYAVRNKRDVWTVNTKSYRDAHFATFPEKLIVDCISAGCPAGGIVLDPFMGAGTTAVVARKLNRNFVGIELNPEYIEIANKRLYKELGMWL